MPTLDYLTLIVIAAQQPRCGVQHVCDGAALGDVEHAACCIEMDKNIGDDQGSPALSDVEIYLGNATRCSVCSEMIVEYYHAP